MVGALRSAQNFEQWIQEILRAAKKARTKADAILHVPDIPEKRGFVKAKIASTKWPIGPCANGAREKRVGEQYLKVSADDRVCQRSS